MYGTTIRKGIMTNLILESRERLEMYVHHKIEREKEARWSKIKKDYYERNPKAKRFIPVDMEEYRKVMIYLSKNSWYRTGSKTRIDLPLTPEETVV